METPMSVSSPRWCFVCVSLLYNTPNPQADSDNIDSMTLYLFLCWGLIQQKSRQRQKGETTRGWRKGKGLSLVSPCVVYRCVSLKRYIHWTSNETEFPIPFITVYQSNWREACNVHRQPDISNIFAHSYLPTENNSTSVCRGTLVWVTILSSFRSRCWTVFPLKCCFLEQPLSGLDRGPGVVEMRPGPRTAPLLGGRARAANFPLASESKRL